MPTEDRCILCDCPAMDHVPLRYVWRVWWRHHLIPIAGFILARLPLGGTKTDW